MNLIARTHRHTIHSAGRVGRSGGVSPGSLCHAASGVERIDLRVVVTNLNTLVVPQHDLILPAEAPSGSTSSNTRRAAATNSPSASTPAEVSAAANSSRCAPP
jgi:hypothetical protein